MITLQDSVYNLNDVHVRARHLYSQGRSFTSKKQGHQVQIFSFKLQLQFSRTVTFRDHYCFVTHFCSFLLQYNTPLEKFHCLKKAVTIVTDRKMKTPEGQFTYLRVVTKISSCRVNTTSGRGIKQLGISFGSIFLFCSFESSRGRRSQ